MSGLALPNDLSPTRRARIAGVLYLTCIAAGLYAEAVVRSKIVFYDDAAATARNIIASPWLYRFGLFADLLSFITGILVAIIFYGLFREVSRPAARTALAFAMVSNTVSIAGSIFYAAPMHILAGNAYLAAFPPVQLQSLALLSLRLYQFAFVVNLGLFSVDCFATGYLIFRSTFLPRPLGLLLGLGGACYLVNSVAYFLPPHALPDLFPYIYLPSFIAELSLASWLVIAAVNAEKWRAVRSARREADCGRPI